MHMFINESGSRLFRIKWWIKMKYYKIVLELYFDTVEKYLRGPYPDVSNNWSMFYPQTQMLRPHSCKQWHLLSTTIEQTALTILRGSFLLNTHSKKKKNRFYPSDGPQTIHAYIWLFCSSEFNHFYLNFKHCTYFLMVTLNFIMKMKATKKIIKIQILYPLIISKLSFLNTQYHIVENFLHKKFN